MIFNDFAFLGIFLPATLMAFHLAPRLWRRDVLLLAGLVFYGVSGLEHLAVLVLGMAWTYALSCGPTFVGSRWRLSLAIAGPLIALAWYKYARFFAANVGAEFSLLQHVLLPAGISFFTFEFISYAIDRYRGRIQEPPGFRPFALYVSFFPHLVAGPILRFPEVAEPIARLAEFRLGRRDVEEAIGFIALGLAAKVLLADSLDNLAAPLAAEPGALRTSAAAYVTLAYSFQIYFDFYGYSLVAIGLGKLFGFRLPDNFRRPYESLNPRDFWRRWHMTLSFWIRDYLYLPLGGNRAYRRNILIVFALCGLWHGAGWNFIAWGLWHALLVLGYGAAAPLWDRMPALVQRAATFLLVSLGWLLFLYDFDGAWRLAQSLLGLGSGDGPQATPWMWAMLGVAALCCFAVHPERLAEGPRRRAGYTLALAASFFGAVLFFDQSQSFIYFRF